MKNRSRRYAVSGVLTLAVNVSAFAQDAISFLNEANSQIRGAGSVVYDVVVAVIAIIAIISLVVVGVKMSSGDNEATQKAIGWAGGIVFCLIAAVVIKNYMGL
ncbi:MAG: DUF4134 family protein [Bacteroidales bacterium]|jgi:hypothetical protein|nr:DUF4134 family protein [Bacteroidales bacterium]